MAASVIVAACDRTVAAPRRTRPPVIGYLGGFGGPSDALRDGLRELGWTEGESFSLEPRLGEQSAGALSESATELVRLGVEVFVAQGAASALAARDAARGTAVPVVFGFTADPLELGIVDSLSRPSGNVTGFGFQTADAVAKQVELFKELIPGATVMAAIFDPIGGPGRERALVGVKDAAPRLGVQLLAYPVSSLAEVEQAFISARAAHARAMIDINSAVGGARLGSLAISSGIPTGHLTRVDVDAGGLLSLGPDAQDSMRKAAGYVDKVLRGTKVQDLPVQLPVTFDLVINLKTAQAMGLEIPPSILSRAAAVIR